jgi:hypothetical protein
MIYKNKDIVICADRFSHLFVNVYKKGKKELIGQYKIDGYINGVDVEISTPKGCRTEYAKIIKIK